VRDTSSCPRGFSGTIVEVRVFNRHGIESRRPYHPRSERNQTPQGQRGRAQHPHSLATYNRLRGIVIGQVVASTEPKAAKKDQVIDEGLAGRSRTHHEWWKFAVADDARQTQLETCASV
jgi:DNA-directed RNA polymerase subunit beta